MLGPGLESELVLVPEPVPELAPVLGLAWAPELALVLELELVPVPVRRRQSGLTPAQG